MRLFLLMAFLATTFMPNTSKNPSTQTPSPSTVQSDELKSLNSEKISLQNQMNGLKEKQDFWDRTNLRLSIVLLIAASILGGLVWLSQRSSSKSSIAQRPINARILKIDERINAINSDVNSSALAETQRRVADAQGNVENLQKAASDAKAAQQKVELELEKQREKTAKAEKTLLEIAKVQNPRFIEGHSLSDSLKGKPTGTITIWYQPNDTEAYWFAFQIMGEFSKAGWTVPMPSPIPENISSVAFLGPEFQSPGINTIDRLLPPAIRVGGATELGLMSKHSVDPSQPDSLINILTSALKPLARKNFSWKLASTLPEDAFILIVGPKP